MAAAAELRLLEKSLGLKPGNKYSAQGERQVRRRGRKVAGQGGEVTQSLQDPAGTQEWTLLPTCMRGGPRGSVWTAGKCQPSPLSRKPGRGGVGRAGGSDPCRRPLAMPLPFIQRPP